MRLVDEPPVARADPLRSLRHGWSPRAAYEHPDEIPWEQKKPVLWWFVPAPWCQCACDLTIYRRRGQTSGGRMEGTNYRHFDRFRFITLANKRPDLINAKCESSLPGRSSHHI